MNANIRHSLYRNSFSFFPHLQKKNFSAVFSLKSIVAKSMSSIISSEEAEQSAFKGFSVLFEQRQTGEATAKESRN